MTLQRHLKVSLDRASAGAGQHRQESDRSRLRRVGESGEFNLVELVCDSRVAK